MSEGIYILAEAGVNHNGDVAMAYELIDAAAAAGADAVKFQAFKAAALVNDSAPKADYQTQTTGEGESQLAMLKRLELGEDDLLALAEACKTRGIEFVCTPFDSQSLAFLHETVGVKRIKISSGDATNGPLLEEIGRTGLPSILSTGMCDLGDIEGGLGALACGYLGVSASKSARADALVSPEGQRLLRQNVTLLHCTTEYPAPIDEINLRAMDVLRSAFGLAVGYSDHTPGTTVPVAAAAMGACMLEKHFTLDRELPGPDHRASLEPGELRSMVEQVRSIERALGDGRKTVSPSEAKNMSVARKSLVAAQAIRQGETFTPENLGVKRPGTGVSPMRYWEFVGRVADRDYRPDEVIEG